MGTDRPYRIGFVSWPLIIGAMLYLYQSMKLLGTPAFDQMLSGMLYSALTAKIILFGSCTLLIISGICMYERQGWARYVYLLAAIPFYYQRCMLAKALYAPGGVEVKPGLSVMPQHLVLVEISLVGAAIFYLFSIWALFSWRSRRYYHPPMYIDE